MERAKVIRIARYVATAFFAYITVVMVYYALTEPAIIATPYILVAAICGFLTWRAWPRRKKKEPVT